MHVLYTILVMDDDMIQTERESDKQTNTHQWDNDNNNK